ncbi:MAG: CBS domain-containing protein [Chloroflexi bacterium]|jgi:acetoin utilization protein AcuB|nr:CBS domain-containing protein [Chloroflexota bacterium]
MKHYLVKDWMQTKVITAGPNMGMLEAHRLMRNNKIRRLPIVSRNGKLVGIVTRSDVRQAEPSEATTLNVWEMNYLLAKLQLGDIMTQEPYHVHPDDSIKTAATLMHSNKIGALPVVDDDNKVVGILTESDVFRVLIEWFDEDMGAIAEGG